MPVKLLDAKAAASALHGVADAVIKNAQLHDSSHWSKQKADAEIQKGKSTCGYYRRESQRDKWTRSTDGDVSYTKPTPKKLKKYNKTTETNYHAIDVNGCWVLLSHALKTGKGDLGALYVEGSTGTRFVLGTSFPANYGGETLRKNGNDEDCTRIAVVIETGGGGNAQIVTHFPAADSYFTGKTALV